MISFFIKKKRKRGRLMSVIALSILCYSLLNERIYVYILCKDAYAPGATILEAEVKIGWGRDLREINLIDSFNNDLLWTDMLINRTITIGTKYYGDEVLSLRTEITSRLRTLFLWCPPDKKKFIYVRGAYSNNQCPDVIVKVPDHYNTVSLCMLYVHRARRYMF